MRPARSRAHHHRGFTLVELLVSMTIIGLLLGAILVEFTQAFCHVALTQANLSSEQQARLAAAKVGNEFSQATQDITDCGASPCKPLLAPLPSSTSAPSVSFYRARGLDPGSMAIDPASGAPRPSYDVVTISWDPTSQTISEYVVPAALYPAAPASVTLLARHVTNFGVSQLSDAEFLVTVEVLDLTRASRPEPPFQLTDDVRLID